ncbi:monovalent cation/H(+) antiporter subunit G [Corticicoccus populi]|uniref:Monovalent cation/H(+) antiporter subunit G n=1 Tax=Corticicoccus populi TaxID=1812821 RepID=A0ABW5WUV5_9STAP
MTSLISILLLGGSLVTSFSMIGIVRLPDMYSRLHAATKGATLGVIMLMLGTFFYFWYVKGEIDSQILLAAVFILITAPVSGHMLSRSAFHADVEPYKLTVLNELRRDETGTDVEDDVED